MKRDWKRGMIFEFLAWIDCGFNVLTMGNHEVMVSQRVGRFQVKAPTKYWNLLAAIIDFTFKPIDGPNHCREAYKKNKDEQFYRGNDIALAILALIICLGCGLILIPIMYLVIVPLLWLIDKIEGIFTKIFLSLKKHL